MLLASKERIRPLVSVVDDLPALLLVMFFLKLLMEAEGPQHYHKRYVISYHHQSPVVDFSKNMQMRE